MAEKYDLYMQVGKNSFEVDDDLTVLELKGQTLMVHM